MLLLLFHLGNDRCALESSQVMAVIPMVSLRKIPKAPDYVAGLLNYRGLLVPVIDLSQLTQGQPCQRRLSTRILLVNYLSQAGAPYVLGLLAERVTDTVKKEKTDFFSSGIKVQEAPYLGAIGIDEQGMIQCVRVEHLLPDSVRECLFAEATEQT